MRLVEDPHQGQKSCNLCAAWRRPEDLVDGPNGERWCRNHNVIDDVPPNFRSSVVPPPDGPVERMLRRKAQEESSIVPPPAPKDRRAPNERLLTGEAAIRPNENVSALLRALPSRAQDENGLPSELAQALDQAAERTRAEEEVAMRLSGSRVAADLVSQVAFLQTGWAAAHCLHAGEHLCVDDDGKAGWFTTHMTCPTRLALEQVPPKP